MTRVEGGREPGWIWWVVALVGPAMLLGTCTARGTDAMPSASHAAPGAIDATGPGDDRDGEETAPCDEAGGCAEEGVTLEHVIYVAPGERVTIRTRDPNGGDPVLRVSANAMTVGWR